MLNCTIIIKLSSGVVSVLQSSKKVQLICFSKKWKTDTWWSYLGCHICILLTSFSISWELWIPTVGMSFITTNMIVETETEFELYWHLVQYFLFRMLKVIYVEQQCCWMATVMGLWNNNCSFIELEANSALLTSLRLEEIISNGVTWNGCLWSYV